MRLSIFLFHHKESGLYYYGCGVDVTEAKRGLVETLNYRPTTHSIKDRLNRHHRLLKEGVVVPGRNNNYYPRHWSIKKVLPTTSPAYFKRFLAEIHRNLPEENKLINIIEVSKDQGEQDGVA